MLKKLLIGLCAIFVLGGCAGRNVPESIDGRRIYFEFDSAEISTEAKQELIEVARFMKWNHDVNIIIEGHTDARGSAKYNLALGSVRAANAAHVIYEYGIAADRVNAVSFGKSRPVADGSGEEVWRLNRSATIRVVE
ncbi:MAG: OmpA family protein [Alphaproteobacteria bacterium]|nr:OmpA family protein [Alphaproteobacteria bacterium]